MLYTEIALFTSATVLSLVLLIFILAQKNRGILNIFSGINSLVSLLLFTCLLIEVLNIPEFQSLGILKGCASLALILLIFILLLTLIYPDSKIKKRIPLIILFTVPGLSLAVGVFITDLIIIDAVFNNAIVITKGTYFSLYTITLYTYVILIPLLTFFKALMYENKAFRKELLLLFFGLTFSAAGIVSALEVVPQFSNQFSIAASVCTISVMVQLFLLNYSIANIELLDLRYFYRQILFWTIIFILLFVPVFLSLYFRSILPASEQIHAVGITIFMFFYLFLVFKYLKPKIELVIYRKERYYTAKVEDSFVPVTEFSEEDKTTGSWNDFFEISILKLFHNFNVSGGAFFLYDFRTQTFSKIFETENRNTREEITIEQDLISCLNGLESILYISMLYINNRCIEYKKNLLPLFTKNKLQVAMPFFNNEKRLIGILFMDSLKNKEPYSKSILSNLEIYRIQFQQQLSNIIILEEAKEKQVIQHDKMVISSIKNKLIPGKLNQIKGIRLSSFYINNSDHGGDYFDSRQLSNSRLAIFLSDSSYYGIDSAIISLELYSSFHTPSKYYSSPEKILNVMNWVVETSRISKRYVPALCIMYNTNGNILYSNASMNPLLLFDPKSNKFSSYNTQGVPLGVNKESVYEVKSLQLENGSIGMIYSKGLITSINDQGDSYSIEGIKKIIQENKSGSPAVITRLLYNDYLEFIEEKKQINDVTIIIFKV